MQENTASKGAFKARSGRTVRVGEDGTVMFDHANGYLSPASAMDAEEFFQAKRDEELGRWRWPVEPEYLVYPSDQFREGADGTWIRVVNERTSLADEFARHAEVKAFRLVGRFREAALAYFEAHPERKPWHGAVSGEFWMVHHAGTVEVCRVDGNRFVGVDDRGTHVSMPITHASITAASRMVTEKAS